MSDEAREPVMALYAACAQDVFNYAYHNTHSVDACEELVQAVFTALCEKLERGETLLPTELPAGPGRYCACGFSKVLRTKKSRRR